MFNWLCQYEWLCYSPSSDGGFCLICVLFGDECKTIRMKKLFSEPLKHFKDSKKCLANHFADEKKNSQHNICLELYHTFNRNYITRKSLPIDIQTSVSSQTKIATYSRALESIIDVVIHHGRQGFSFRGHRDDFKYYPPVGESSYDNNPGNFVENLNFAVRHGDKILEEHLKNAPLNARYTSAPIQNELISLCGKYITDKIVNEVKDAKFFTVLADEVRDISGKEQLALVIRFVDKSGVVREEFLQFILCDKGLSGMQIAEYILFALDNLGLDISNCRGQGYDGAPSMSGKHAGCFTFILEKCDKSLYFHCFSHRLNLCVQNSLQIDDVKTMLKLISGITYYFESSEPRQRSFTQHILRARESRIISTNKTKLFDVCKTRWVARIEGLVAFHELLKPMVSCFQDLQKMNSQKNFRDVRATKALGFLDKTYDYVFIAFLVITMKIMCVTSEVTTLLQEKAMDIVKGVHLITTLIEEIKTRRKDIDHTHDEYYQEALDTAREISELNKNMMPITEELPRIVSKQLYRANAPSETTSGYYKNNVTIPMLDHLSTSLDSRFNENTKLVYEAFSILPNYVVDSAGDGKTCDQWKVTLMKFALFYKDDLPNYGLLNSELDTYHTYWVSFNKDFKNEKIPSSVSETLQHLCFKSFANMKVILRILGTVPVTTCTCERSISKLRLLKDYTQSTMINDRLNGIVLMHIHREIKIDAKKVLRDFIGPGNRRFLK